jgi:hypothetical protein
MPKTRWFRVVTPPVEFDIKESKDGWFEVFRNRQPMSVAMSSGNEVAVRFENRKVAEGFCLACQILEKRFQ